MKTNCALCKHRNHLYLKCSAYPDEIPKEIANGQKKHDQFLTGQQGQFIYEIHPLYNCPAHATKAERRYKSIIKLQEANNGEN